MIANSPGAVFTGEDVEELALTYQPPPDMSAVTLPPCAMSKADLRMMYHWSTFTWNSIGVGQPGMEEVLQFTLPVLAFDHEFLMNGLLGIASLHLQKLLPDPTEAKRQTSMYRAKAFRGFREALTQMNLKEDNQSYEAALLMSLLLVILCSQDHADDEEDLTVVKWLVLYRGLGTIIMLRSYGEVALTKVGPVFGREINPLSITPVIPQILMAMLASFTPDEPDFPFFKQYCTSLDSLAILFASAQQDGLTPSLFTRIASFPSYFKGEFATLALEKYPRAMIILTWYLAFLKLLKGLWWIDGIPDQDIKIISQMLEPRWGPYLEVPLRVMGTESQEEIINLLLGYHTE